MTGEGVELGAVGVGLTELIAPKLDDGALHPQAKPEVGRHRGPGESGRSNLPLNAAMTESARNHDAVDLVERAQIPALQRFAGDPLDVDPQLVLNPGVPSRFGHPD